MLVALDVARRGFFFFCVLVGIFCVARPWGISLYELQLSERIGDSIVARQQVGFF